MTIENLSHEEQQVLLRWFLYHMPHESRGEFIAQMPTIYAHLYPGTSEDVIIERVRKAIAP